MKSVLDKPSDLESVDSDVSSSADSTVEADASVYYAPLSVDSRVDSSYLHPA